MRIDIGIIEIEKNPRNRCRSKHSETLLRKTSQYKLIAKEGLASGAIEQDRLCRERQMQK